MKIGLIKTIAAFALSSSCGLEPAVSAVIYDNPVRLPNVGGNCAFECGAPNAQQFTRANSTTVQSASIDILFFSVQSAPLPPTATLDWTIYDGLFASALASGSSNPIGLTYVRLWRRILALSRNI